MLPIIIQLSCVLMAILVTMFALGVDLLDKGCLAWHRDSVGYLLQAIVAFVCTLVTSINLMHYIEQFETNDKEAISKFVFHQLIIVLKTENDSVM